ncbi:transposase [Trichloromonas sp.]|uniref:transposase n=1 Tax=Trichloromonas sp. TaxID=3069249 RepID=UPI003D8182C9
MARIARVVAPGYPHHVTQRGNRRQQTFFCDDDYLAYLELMAEWCRKCGVEIWAWCLMPNHVHLIAVPQSEDGLARAIGEAHRRYTRRVNFRENWRGHLWQERFASFPMDESHLLAAARYVEMNPVAAEMVENPVDYRWSSARAHIERKDDALVKVAPLLEIVGDWRSFLSLPPAEDFDLMRKHERTGRPLGKAAFIEDLERTVGRILHPQKPGPKKRGGQG